MVQRKFGRIVNITSSSVKAPIPGLDLSSGARAGLTAFLAGVARTVADKNVTINSILPGAFDTDRLRGGLSKTAEKTGKNITQVAADRINGIPAKRFGDPAEFGAACAFLCSAQAELHHRAESADRRRRVSRRVLGDRRARSQYATQQKRPASPPAFFLSSRAGQPI